MNARIGFVNLLRDFSSSTSDLLVQRVTFKASSSRARFLGVGTWNRVHIWCDEIPQPFRPEVNGAVHCLPAEDLLLFGTRDLDAALRERRLCIGMDPSYGLCEQLPYNFS